VGADEEEENFGTSGFRQPDPAGHGAPEHAHHGLKRQTEMGSTEGAPRVRAVAAACVQPTSTPRGRGIRSQEEAAESFKVFDDGDGDGDEDEEPAGGLSAKEKDYHADYHNFWEDTDGT
jgi:hypothetical protein